MAELSFSWSKIINMIVSTVLRIVFCAWIVSHSVCYGKRYQLCDLVNKLEQFGKYHERFAPFHFNESISLAVCMAGYRYYNNDFKIEYPNGTGHYGMFGVTEKDFDRCAPDRNDPDHNKTHDQWKDYLKSQLGQGDFKCLANAVLRSPSNLKIFRHLCDKSYVRPVQCNVSGYGIVEVHDPIFKGTLEYAFYNECDPRDALEILMSARNCSKVTNNALNSTYVPSHPTICSETQPSTLLILTVLSIIILLSASATVGVVSIVMWIRHSRRNHAINRAFTFNVNNYDEQ